MPRKQDNDEKRAAQTSELLDHVRRVQDDTFELIRSVEAARERELRPPKRHRKKR